MRFFDHNHSWVFKETEDVAKFYAFGRVLGQGQFGTTRLVTELATGKEYACKSISKKKLKREDEVEDVRREVQVCGFALWADLEAGRGGGRGEGASVGMGGMLPGAGRQVRGGGALTLGAGGGAQGVGASVGMGSGQAWV